LPGAATLAPPPWVKIRVSTGGLVFLAFLLSSLASLIKQLPPPPSDAADGKPTDIAK
jgi:hypothetical protein